MKKILTKASPILFRLFTFISLLIFTSFGCLSLCGFTSLKSIDQYSYVIAIGIDKGTTSPLKITFQVAIPSPSSSSGDNSNSQDSTISTVECSSIDSGINILNDYFRKEVSLTHCKVLVFSEELASDGISPYINTLFNDVEIRPTCSIFISRSDCESFLKASGTHFQGVTSKSYESTTNSIRYNGYLSSSKLGTFFSNLQDTFSSAYTTLVSVNNQSTIEEKSNIASSMNAVGANLDSNYVAGESPINRAQDSAEHLGLAVFKGDQFVGELNGIETLCHLMVISELQEALVTIPNPLQESGFVDLSIELKKDTKTKVDLVNGTPFINVSVSLEAKVLSIDSNTDYSDEDTLRQIEEYASKYFQQNLLEYLYKTSKMYHADIASFGSKASAHFLTWQDWTEYNWLSHYQDSFFATDVSVQIHSSSFLQSV